MAKFEEGVAQNLRGRFYVDESCVYCGLCDAIVPTVFQYFKEGGWAVFFHQPKSEAELAAADECVDACPTESIGRGGEEHDWSAVPPHPATYV